MEKQLWQRSAIELARGIRSGNFSSEDVVTAHLERIEAINHKLGAITVVLADSALEAARLADQQAPAGPLHGVPFTIKENIDCVGSPTTDGVPALAEAMPHMDSPTVERMKAAGAIPLGRTNLPELALRISTDNPLRGRTYNPFNADRVAGGSSGGEASAIATGMSPLGLGNDIGGSLRNPAYCCGITALKPTVGRIPQARCLPPSDNPGLASQIMAVEGPMARHVGDLRLAYEVLSGRHWRDPVSVDSPLYGSPPQARRAALVTEIPGITLSDIQTNEIKRAGASLAAAGWHVEAATPPELEAVTEMWARILAMEFSPLTDQFSMVMTKPAVDFIRGLCDKYEPALPQSVVHSERWRLGRAWSQFFADYPVVIGPTWTDIPFLHDADIEPGGLEMAIDILRFITPANLLGLPAVPVPMGIHEGMPTGIQILADQWREDIVFQAAEIVEAAAGQITPVDPTF